MYQLSGDCSRTTTPAIGGPFLLHWISKCLPDCWEVPGLCLSIQAVLWVFVYLKFLACSCFSCLLFSLSSCIGSFQMLDPPGAKAKHCWCGQSSVSPGVFAFVVLNSMGSHQCCDTVLWSEETMAAMEVNGRGVVSTVLPSGLYCLPTSLSPQSPLSPLTHLCPLHHPSVPSLISVPSPTSLPLTHFMEIQVLLLLPHGYFWNQANMSYKALGTFGVLIAVLDEASF